MRQKQILVVEDNELNREMLAEILSAQYTILEAENGEVALDILHKHKNDIALILLDIQMPVMDGHTFLNKIKEDSEYALIPVIVMTQGDSEEDEVTALSHGATDFVPKPYRPQVILHRVASIIKLRETAAIVNLLQYGGRSSFTTNCATDKGKIWRKCGLRQIRSGPFSVFAGKQPGAGT